MEQTTHECGCHGPCGCDATPEEQIKILESTRVLLLTRARCVERKITALKGQGRAAHNK